MLISFPGLVGKNEKKNLANNVIPGTFLDRLKTVVLGVVHNYHNQYILRQAFTK